MSIPFRKYYSVEQVRALDQWAIKDIGIPGMVLMERAGIQVAEACWQLLNERPAQVAVVCGKGNNGGDGMVAARILREKGCAVQVYSLYSPKDYHGEVLKNYQILTNLGILPQKIEDVASWRTNLRQYALLIDAIWGTGFRGKINDYHLRDIIQTINGFAGKVVAVDIPSGLSNEKEQNDLAVKADITVTFQFFKKGFDRRDWKKYLGKVKVVNIGIPVFASNLSI